MKPMNPQACSLCHNSPCSCKSLTTKILFVVVILALAVGGYWAYSSGMMMGHMGPKSDIKMSDETMMKMDPMPKDHMMMSGTMMQKEAPKMAKDSIMKAGSYVPYDAQVLAESLKSGKKVALFFHANWCPTCRNLDANIVKDLTQIPADTMIFKVDYDNSDDLKQKYGVTTQSVTLVLSFDGTEKSRKIGAKNIADIFE